MMSVPNSQRCTEIQRGEFDRSSIEARLSGKRESLDWIIGVDAFESEDMYQQAETGRGNNSFVIDVLNDVTSWSIFGGGEWRLTEQLSLSAEARVTSEDKDLQSLALLTNFDPELELISEDLDETWTYSTWTTSLSYRFTPDIMAYARIGTGFRTGGLNTDSRDIADPDTGVPIVVPETFDEERGISYELGLKNTFLDGALVLNLSAYRVDYKDFISNATNGLAGLDRVGYVFNIGDAELDGVEIETQYVVNNLPGNATLSINGGVAYTEGDISDPVDPANAGLKISRVPEWSYTLSTKLDVPLSETLTGLASLRYRGQEGGFQTFSNNTELPEPNLATLSIGVRGASWSVNAYVENLTDEDEPVRNVTAGNISVAREPRTWGLIFSKSLF